MMLKHIFPLLMLFAAILQLSCSRTFTPAGPSPANISRIDHIQWNLTRVNPPAPFGGVENYAPFKWVLLNDAIWGHDGCNFLRGDCSIIDDTLAISDYRITEIGCSPHQHYIPFAHLLSRPRIMVTDEGLELQHHDSIWTYTSPFSDELPPSSSLDQTLTLNESNDFAFTFFTTLGYLPQLNLTSHRDFSIQWYNKSPETTTFINKRSGIFGINGKNEIQFTVINFQYEGNNYTSVDSDLIDRLLSGNRYSEKDGIFKITNDAASTFYEFSR